MSLSFFTVAIPTQNRVDRRRDAVRSMSEQTYRDFEVICSGESHQFETAELLEYLALSRIELQ